MGSALSAVYHPYAGRGAESLGGVEIAHLWLGAVGDAGGVREQVADRDGAFRGNDPDAGLVLDRDGGLAEGGNEMADRIVQADLAFLEERQHGGAGDGLGLRGDAEDGVGGHLPAGFFIAPADGVLVDGLAVVQHQGDGAGDLVLIDILLEQMIDTGHALRGIDRLSARGAGDNEQG